MIGAKEKLAARLGPALLDERQGQAPGRRIRRPRREAEGATAANVDALIIQMGNNGPLYSEEMEAIRKATARRRRALPDQRPRAGLLDRRVRRNARRSRRDLAPHDADRLALGRGGPRDSLLWDGLHLNPAGAGVYARIVSRAVHDHFRCARGSTSPQAESKPRRKPRAQSPRGCRTPAQEMSK